MTQNMAKNLPGPPNASEILKGPSNTPSQGAGLIRPNAYQQPARSGLERLLGRGTPARKPRLELGDCSGNPP